MEEQRPKKRLDQVRDTIRLKHYAIRTEQVYVGWIVRYIPIQGIAPLPQEPRRTVAAAQRVSKIVEYGDRLHPPTEYLRLP